MTRVYVDRATGRYGVVSDLITFDVDDAELAGFEAMAAPERIALADRRGGRGHHGLWPGEDDEFTCRHCRQLIEHDTSVDPPWVHVATGDAYCGSGHGYKAEPA